MNNYLFIDEILLNCLIVNTTTRQKNLVDELTRYLQLADEGVASSILPNDVAFSVCFWRTREILINHCTCNSVRFTYISLSMAFFHEILFTCNFYNQCLYCCLVMFTVFVCTGLQQLEMICCFGCISLVANYVVFMSVFPAALALFLEVRRRWR